MSSWPTARVKMAIDAAGVMIFTDETRVTKTEVALAKQLFNEWSEHYSYSSHWRYEALEQFTEKIERILEEEWKDGTTEPYKHGDANLFAMHGRGVHG